MFRELSARNCWMTEVQLSRHVYVERSLHVRPFFLQSGRPRTLSTHFLHTGLRSNLAIYPQGTLLTFELFSSCVILVDQIGLRIEGLIVAIRVIFVSARFRKTATSQRSA